MTTTSIIDVSLNFAAVARDLTNMILCSKTCATPTSLQLVPMQIEMEIGTDLEKDHWTVGIQLPEDSVYDYMGVWVASARDSQIVPTALDVHTLGKFPLSVVFDFGIEEDSAKSGSSMSFGRKYVDNHMLMEYLKNDILMFFMLMKVPHVNGVTILEIEIADTEEG